MQRIMIVGGPGSGKSTLARWIGARTGLPIVHLDQVHWKPNWVARDAVERIAMVTRAQRRDRWIIEGGISTTFATRATRADLVIWLDLPIGLRLRRVVLRSWYFRGRNRPDLPDGCVERFDRETWAFLRFVWTTRHSHRARILRTIEEVRPALAHLRSPADVAAFKRGFVVPNPLDQGT